jgi:hypothetical protein
MTWELPCSHTYNIVITVIKILLTIICVVLSTLFVGVTIYARDLKGKMKDLQEKNILLQSHLIEFSKSSKVDKSSLINFLVKSGLVFKLVEIVSLARLGQLAPFALLRVLFK